MTMNMEMIEKINHMTEVLKSEREPALSESENLALSLRRHLPEHRSPEDTVRYLMEGDREFCDAETSTEKEVSENDRSMGEQYHDYVKLIYMFTGERAGGFYEKDTETVTADDLAAVKERYLCVKNEFCRTILGDMSVQEDACSHSEAGKREAAVAKELTASEDAADLEDATAAGELTEAEHPADIDHPTERHYAELAIYILLRQGELDGLFSEEMDDETQGRMLGSMIAAAFRIANAKIRMILGKITSDEALEIINGAVTVTAVILLSVTVAGMAVGAAVETLIVLVNVASVISLAMLGLNMGRMAADALMMRKNRNMSEEIFGAAQDEADDAVDADEAADTGEADHADEADHTGEADHADGADHADEADEADKTDHRYNRDNNTDEEDETPAYA
ncbi:MAG: hypothetical protein LIO80_10030 [Lachnospiraceae bacterium]|nr:hypothetical protein [Lachnospiraceae bacterium]